MEERRAVPVIGCYVERLARTVKFDAKYAGHSTEYLVHHCLLMPFVDDVEPGEYRAFHGERYPDVSTEAPVFTDDVS